MADEKEFKHTDAQLEYQHHDGAYRKQNNIVENPLLRYTDEQVIQGAELFTKDKGLDEYRELFANAALVARDPDGFNHIPSLSEEERSALQYEVDHKWSQPKMLYFAMLLCAIGAATQGWDQTGSNGANLSFPAEFKINTPHDEPGGVRDEWLLGLINSAPYLSGGLIGVWLSDPLNAWFGRRGEIFITAICLVATPIAAAFTKNWGSMLAVRLVMGLGLGAKAATVPVYSAEMAPARIRGALTMGWQLWVCFGIFLGFAANCVVMDTGKIAWRLQIGSAFIPALPLALFIFMIPESPRWLMKKNRYPEAFASYLKIRSAPIIAARDLYYSHVLYEEEKALAEGSTYISRLLDCFRIPRIRRATLAAGTVMLAQQMCGINIIAFYSSTVFVESGLSARQALYASLGFGALNFAFAIPAVFTIDTFGRRALLLATFPGMCISVLITGLMFLLPQYSTAPAADGTGGVYNTTRLALIALFIYIFTIFYSVGEGPVCFLYGAEVFPTIQREQGMAFSVMINLFFAAVLGMTFPPMLRALSPVGAFGFYAGLNLLAFIMIFLWVPETKALTLEELDQVFSVPTKSYINYQIQHTLFRRNIPPPRPVDH
ncbi:hypothetical protein Q8F55_006211 [Vanrija albida]|uniref:Major facilitator superfamily (MFS) profile domain-containing protein n=1 Tax=Vanrija albida TaxID=181172 RepID=A0ABR3PWJ5_9TREE